MSLRDILQTIADDKMPISLCDHNKDWDAIELLETLSDPMLNRSAHMQPGLYIAAINDAGYLGEVLYRVKQRPSTS